jgi:hypothetical protein
MSSLSGAVILGVVAGSAGFAYAQPNNWTLRNSQTTAILYGATYGPFNGVGTFVASGSGGVLCLSSDGINWTPFTVTDVGLLDVESNGSGGFMAVGSNGMKYGFGTSCTAIANDNALWAGVAYGNGIWSVVGGEYRFSGNQWFDSYRRSLNCGSTWSNYNTELSAQLETPNDVVFGGGAFLAGYGGAFDGFGGRIRRSTDGLTFSTVLNTYGTVSGLAYNGSTWIAAGRFGRIYRSTDGGFSWSTSFFSGEPYFTAVFSGGGYFVLGTLNGQIYYSTDGLSWTQTQSPITTELSGGAYGNGTWILVGSEGKILQTSLKADLAPYQPAGWSGPIVVSDQAGTTQDSPLTSCTPVFVDIAWANLGLTNAGAFRVDVFIDNQFYGFINSPGLNANSAQFVLDVNVGDLATGSHTIRIVLDSQSAVSEIDEVGNNTFSKTFQVNSSDCAADFDGSCFVDVDDFAAFVAAFEIGEDNADFDESGFVDLDDFAAFVSAFSEGC